MRRIVPLWSWSRSLCGQGWVLICGSPRWDWETPYRALDLSVLTSVARKVGLGFVRDEIPIPAPPAIFVLPGHACEGTVTGPYQRRTGQLETRVRRASWADSSPACAGLRMVRPWTEPGNRSGRMPEREMKNLVGAACSHVDGIRVPRMALRWLILTRRAMQEEPSLQSRCSHRGVHAAPRKIG